MTPMLEAPPPVIVDDYDGQDPINVKLDLDEYPESRDRDEGVPGLHSLAMEICELIDESYSQTQELRENITKWRRQYHDTVGSVSVDEMPFEGGANVHTPTTLNHTDSLHSQVWRVCTGTDPYMKLSGRPKTLLEMPADEVARISEHMLHQQLRDDIRYEASLDVNLKDALNDGTKVVKICWRKEQKKVLRPKRRGRSAVEEHTLATVRNAPTQESIPIEDFAVWPVDRLALHPSVPDPQPIIMIGHRSWLTRSDLLSGVRDGIYDEDAVDRIVEKPTMGRRRGEETDTGRREQQEEMGIGSTNYFKARHEPYEIWEVCMKVVVKDKEDEGDYGIAEDYLVTLDYGTREIIRVQPFPYWHGKLPYAVYRPFPVSDSFFGKSLSQILESIQDQIDDRTNQLLNQGTLSNTIFYTYLRGRRNALEGRKLKLGQGIEVDEHDDFMFHNPYVGGSEVGLDLQILNQLAEKASGVNDVSAGVSPSKSRPLGETNALLEQAGHKFEVVISRIQETNADIALQVLGLDLQYLSPDREMLLTGKEEPIFTRLSWEDVMEKLVITPFGNTVNTSREFMLASREKLKLWQERAPAAQTPTRSWQVDKEFLRGAMNIYNIEDFIGTFEEAQKAEGQEPPPPPLFEVPRLSITDPKVATALQVFEHPEFGQALEMIIPFLEKLGIGKDDEGDKEAAVKKIQQEADMAEDELKAAAERERMQTDMEKERAIHEIEMATMKQQMNAEELTMKINQLKDQAAADAQMQQQKLANQQKKAQMDEQARQQRMKSNGAGKPR